MVELRPQGVRRRAILPAAALPQHRRLPDPEPLHRRPRQQDGPGGERLRVHRQQVRHSPKFPGIGPAADAISFSFARTFPDQEAAEQQAIRQGALFPTLGHGRRRVLPQRPLRTLSFLRRPIRRCSNTTGRSRARSRPCPGNGSSRRSGSSFRGRKRRNRKRSRRSPFTSIFKGDFKYLDLVKLAEALELAPELLDAEEGKYAITCPWSSEHTETAQADSPRRSSTRKNSGAGWPGFKCLHSHCEAREFEGFPHMGREPGERNRRLGIARKMRVWHEGQTDSTASPRILHPQFNELDSVSHTKLGKIMGERQAWFDWLGKVCLLDNIRSGKIYIGERGGEASTHMPATVTGFKELEGIKARGHCEYFLHSRIPEKGRSRESATSSGKLSDRVLQRRVGRSASPGRASQPAPDPDRSHSLPRPQRARN